MSDGESIDGALRRAGEGPLPSGDADGMLDRVVAHVLGNDAPVKSIGRFEVVRSLGAGGMGTVLEAWDAELERKVAIKLLRTELGTRDRRREIIEAEARALAKLADRHVVQIYETGEHEGSLFVVMELVEGTTLERWQREEDPSTEALIDKYAQAALGLAAAHRAGMVHRDFKPANVLVRKDGEVRVADFGLAQLMDEVHVTADLAASPDVDSGARSGTRAYMAPEQLAFGTTDARSDQFSLCVALFEALTGERPFDARALAAMAEREAVTISSEYTAIPRLYRAVILRGLTADPSGRWPSLDDMVQELRRAPRRRQLRRVVAAASIGVAGVATAFVLGEPPRPSCDPSAQLDGVWDDAVAERLSVSVPSEVGFAARASEHAHGRLDTYAERWGETYRQSCEDTWVRGLESEDHFEQVVGCLQDRRGALAGAVRLLGQGDVAVLARASDIVEALRSPESCVTQTDAEVSERERTLLEAADEATLTLVAGLPREALKRIEHTDLSAADSHPAAARAWLARGRAYAVLSEFDAAEQSLLRAAGLAGAHDAPGLGVEALGHLLRFYAVTLAEASRTQLAIELLETWSSGVELDAMQTYGLWLGLGDAAAALGDPDLALERLERARAALPPGASIVQHVDVDLAVAAVYYDQGKFDDSGATYAQALVSLSDALGPTHPRVAAVEHGLGSVALARDDEEGVRRHFERALQLSTDALGGHSPQRASALTGLAQLDLSLGRYAQAAAGAAEAWSIQQALPQGHPDRGSGLQLLAFTALQTGEYSTALERFESLLRESPTEDPEIRVGTLINVGWLLCEVDRCAEARRSFEQALASPAITPQWRLYIEEGLARVALAEGREGAALSRAERLLARIADEQIDLPELKAGALSVVAMTLDPRRHEARRRILAAEALATFEKLGRQTTRTQALQAIVQGANPLEPR